MKRNYLLLLLLAGGAFFILTGTSQAASINIIENHGTTEFVRQIDDYNTTGLNMTGMDVTVTFSNGTTQTVSWDTDGGGNYHSGIGAQGTGWSLTMVDPTKSTYYGSYWALDVTDPNVLISSVLLEGFDDNVVFDNDEDNFPGTQGSAWGNPLDISDRPQLPVPATTYDGVIDVTYIGDVAINGTTAYGDVYRSMLISFTNGPFDTNDTLYFHQDTDNVNNPVPEPATMLMFGVGLSGIVAIRSRKKKN